MGYKRLKDPLYGYIPIESSIMERIVDTAEFQRLRNVIQTSYAPLYSSAVHNRFVHSLGVYYLGSIVAFTISRDFDTKSKEQISGFDKLLYIFKLACLLHDVGHAPFSHTGENYYLNNSDRTPLHNRIAELINDEDFLDEIGSKKGYTAAPHELMSVIVALTNYSDQFDTAEEKSFFARCIVGYPYFNKGGIVNSFKNCLISLLNSSVIDVDKLDYLIRDAYITGFETVSIDYERLLKNVKLVTDKEGLYRVAFKQGAISVIENVVYAHDAERKWIQTHPIVQYESFLLATVIQSLMEKYKGVNIFSEEALSKKGIELSDSYSISLLCDADILFLMKNIKDSSVVDEYLCRKTRRHPLWKSESEYKAIFSRGMESRELETIEETLDFVCKVCNTHIINETTIQKLEKDIEDQEALKKEDPRNEDNYNLSIEKRKKCKKWIEELKNFANEQKIEFDFVVINPKQFNSGFAKSAFGEIEIIFDTLDKPCIFKDVTNVLNANASDREQFFYLFYRKKEDKTSVDLKQLAVKLGDIAIGDICEKEVLETKENYSKRTAEMKKQFE